MKLSNVWLRKWLDGLPSWNFRFPNHFRAAPSIGNRLQHLDGQSRAYADHPTWLCTREQTSCPSSTAHVQISRYVAWMLVKYFTTYSFKGVCFLLWTYSVASGRLCQVFWIGITNWTQSQTSHTGQIEMSQTVFFVRKKLFLSPLPFYYSPMSRKSNKCIIRTSNFFTWLL